MPQTNVRTEDVIQLSNKMKTWANHFEQLQQQLRQTSEGIASQWNDPQYEMFINNIRSLGKQMKGNTENLRDQARLLEDMARKQEALQRETRQRQQNIQGRQ